MKRSSRKPMLSACMIVKNEQESLARCLASLAGIVDEVVVVDTGSTDATLTVAREFGAKTFKFEWADDFSKARNFSVAKAQHPWVLVIDADEELERESGTKLKELLAKTPYNALAVQVHNYLGDTPRPELMIGSSVRLFRKDKGFEYRGRIHEDITPSIVERGELIGTSEIILHHYGYLKATAQNESRFDRNVRLLRQQLDDNPDDGNAWFYLGTEYFVAERHAEAFACYQKAVAIMDEKSGLRPRLVRNMVESLRKTGRLAEAQQLVLTALQDYPDYPDLWFLRGLIEEANNESSAAVESLTKAATMDYSLKYETNVTATREKANMSAARILLKQGRPVDCLERLMDVIAANPRLVPAYTLAVQAYLSLGQLEAADELLRLAVRLEPSLKEQLGGVAEKIARLRNR